jgi:hypothetical protein
MAAFLSYAAIFLILILLGINYEKNQWYLTAHSFDLGARRPDHEFLRKKSSGIVLQECYICIDCWDDLYVEGSPNIAYHTFPIE